MSLVVSETPPLDPLHLHPLTGRLKHAKSTWKGRVQKTLMELHERDASRKKHLNGCQLDTSLWLQESFDTHLLRNATDKIWTFATNVGSHGAWNEL